MRFTEPSYSRAARSPDVLMNQAADRGDKSRAGVYFATKGWLEGNVNLSGGTI